MKKNFLIGAMVLVVLSACSTSVQEPPPEPVVQTPVVPKAAIKNFRALNASFQSVLGVNPRSGAYATALRLTLPALPTTSEITNVSSFSLLATDKLATGACTDFVQLAPNHPLRDRIREILASKRDSTEKKRALIQALAEAFWARKPEARETELLATAFADWPMKSAGETRQFLLSVCTIFGTSVEFISL